MSILKSLFFGTEGSYKFFDIPVHFKKRPNNTYSLINYSNNLISQLVNNRICSLVRGVIGQGYIHALVHEMGHAVAVKLLFNRPAIIQPLEVTIFDDCSGESPHEILSIDPSWKESIVLLSGPMANIGFSICKIMSSIVLKNYLSLPIVLSFGIGGAFEIGAELFYCGISALKEDEGDFGDIVQNGGKKHLAIASLAIVTQVALGVFAITKTF